LEYCLINNARFAANANYQFSIIHYFVENIPGIFLKLNFLRECLKSLRQSGRLNSGPNEFIHLISLTARSLISTIMRWMRHATQVFSSAGLIPGIMIDVKSRSFQEK